MSEKPVSQLSKKELQQWLKRRQKEPLYVESDEHEGMSFCYVNPAIIPEDEKTELAIKDEVQPLAKRPRRKTTQRPRKLSRKPGREKRA